MEETLNETLPPLTSETEPPPIPPPLSPPPSLSHQTESPLSPSHQAVSTPPSPPPNTNLCLISFLEYNPKPMTIVFPSKTPSSSDPESIPTVFTSQAPSPFVAKSTGSKPRKSKSSSSIPSRRSQRIRFVIKPPIIDTTVQLYTLLILMEKELKLGFLKLLNLNLRNHPPRERMLKPLLKLLLLHQNNPISLFLIRGNKLLRHLLLNLRKNLKPLAQALRELKQNQAPKRKLKLPL